MISSSASFNLYIRHFWTIIFSLENNEEDNKHPWIQGCTLQDRCARYFSINYFKLYSVFNVTMSRAITFSVQSSLREVWDLYDCIGPHCDNHREIQWTHVSYIYPHRWKRWNIFSSHTYTFLVSLSFSPRHLLLSPSPPSHPLLPTVNWSRSWMRRAVAASCCHGRVASTSAAASAAACPSPSCSTPGASARTVATTSARPAVSTTSGKKTGCAPSARRAGKVGSGWTGGVVVYVCVFAPNTGRLS